MLNDVFRDAILDDDVVDITSTNDETSTFTVIWKMPTTKYILIVSLPNSMIVCLFHFKCLNKVFERYLICFLIFSKS